MLACANEISNGAVGAVYLAAVLPALLVKASAPYWFSHAPYGLRAGAVAALAVAAFLCVGLGGSRTPQLVGVCLASLQSGLGEASTLALAGAYPGHRGLLACWSSGTGFAGPFGYAWVAGLHTLGGFSLRATVLAANLIPAAWCVAQFWMLRSPADAAAAATAAAGALSPGDALAAAHEAVAAESVATATMVTMPGGGLRLEHGTGRASSAGGAGGPALGGAPFSRPRTRSAEAAGSVLAPASPLYRPQSGRVAAPDATAAPGSADAEKGGPASSAAPPDPPPPRGFIATTVHVAGLWRYTVPLLVVYFSEYAAQSGAWAAIGFPSPRDKAARDRFYKLGNWMYQVGVFISRSSGAVFQASMLGLWLMPAAQAGLLAFFVSVAAVRWWYNWGLLVPCFICGLLGGGVYVNAFTLLARHEPASTRELSLGAASVADSIGIALADITGVLLQGCLFRVNGVPGAAFKCGAPAPPPGVVAGGGGGGH
jgi:battenin